MKQKINYLTTLICTILFCCLFQCNPSSKEQEQNIERENVECPSDSTGSYEEKGKHVDFFYLGKSQIEIKTKPDNDTVEVTRFYTTDSIWHVQEYLIVAKNQIVYPEYEMYCTFKDTVESYQLSFISNENRNGNNPELKIDGILGLEVIINNDTLRSSNNLIMVPKKLFRGIIKLDKRMSGIYMGERGFEIASMYIEAETMKKYGNLLEQYKVINRLCNKNGLAQKEKTDSQK